MLLASCLSRYRNVILKVWFRDVNNVQYARPQLHIAAYCVNGEASGEASGEATSKLKVFESGWRFSTRAMPYLHDTTMQSSRQSSLCWEHYR